MIFVVLALFAIKHFVADFWLQTAYMITGKSRGGAEWIPPLALHCGVHSVLSLALICSIRPNAAYLVVIEFILHFVIDRAKTSYQLPSGTWPMQERGKNLGSYYFAFGLDQLAHQITYVAMAYFISLK